MIEKKILKNREEWLRERRHRIGGSDSSAVVGANPYMTNLELWEIKTERKIQEDISEKPFVKYGTVAEEYLRELFKLDFPQYEVFYEENNLFVNDKYPFAHASLDGWLRDENGRAGVLEIKTTNILQSMQREKWNNQVPQNYYVQILHNMMVIQADFAVLKAQLKSEYGGVYLQTKHYLFEREDLKDDINFLIKEEREFFKHIENDTQPNLKLPII